MSFIYNIISENLINAVGWTIIHSLWQGAAVALGLGLILLLFRKMNAQTRYVLGVVALSFVLILSLITFFSLYNHGTQGIEKAGEKVSIVMTTTVSNVQNRDSIMHSFRNYFDRHLFLIVMIWLLGIVVLTLRFTGGYLYNQRLKLNDNHELSIFWQTKLNEFCNKCGITTSIKLVESAIVKIPMTIGHFKPIILFPIGLVSSLPQEQVEALLAHEFAHILRRDYLFNILQNIVDILFFYHPGVYWISSFISAEREKCCDDIAISLSGDSLNYAKALLSTKDYSVRIPDPALAFGGKKIKTQGLLSRVKRLVHSSEKGTELSIGTIFLSILIVFGFFTIAMTANEGITTNRKDAYSKRTTPSPVVETQHIKKEKKENEILIENKKEENVKEKQRNNDAGTNSEENLEQKDKKELIKMIKDMKENENILREKGLLPRLPGEKRISRTEFLKESKRMREPRQRIRTPRNAFLKEGDRISKREERIRTQKRDDFPANRSRPRMSRSKNRIQREELRHPFQLFYKALVPELLKDKLISDKKDFEFRMKNGEISINGEAQSKAIYEKYKNLYEKVTENKMDDEKGIDIINKR